jgi:bifunctional UDP-N-acetylglucosamine pyrophosphorylase/glucosamine-1-phosphate N-acetyltransferase
MKSPLPKVLHPIAGRPLLHQTLHAVLDAEPQARIAIVVGHGREQVEQSVRAVERFKAASIDFVVQEEQRGTGDAAAAAIRSDWGGRIVSEKVPVLVLPGDLPLIRPGLILEMCAKLPKGARMRLLTTTLADPSGYGRVVRRGRAPRGKVLRIVEEKDASSNEKSIREVATSIYLFNPSFLRAGLSRLTPKNAQKEYYLTDLVAQASKDPAGVDVLEWLDSEDLRGVNDLWELAQAHQVLNRRIVRHWAQSGVRFVDPDAVRVDAEVVLEPGAWVGPWVVLEGQTRIGEGCEISASSVLKNAVLERGVRVKPGCVIEESRIASDAQIGPYAHLRPGSKVGEAAKIGNFVELKKTTVGSKSSIAHLSYLGDARVGDRVNIGCGFVTCNYDGFHKHETVIEDEVFLGSDCQTVAPLTVGRGAYVASGSTLTRNVEPGALAIARVRQENKAGYADRLRKRLSSNR